MLSKSSQNQTAPQKHPNQHQNLSSTMSSDTSKLIRKHFSALKEEEEEFTSSHSRTHSRLLGQLKAKEARGLEEALRVLAQEAMERQKKKHKVAPKAT